MAAQNVCLTYGLMVIPNSPLEVVAYNLVWRYIINITTNYL
jgi:hypothetical protein